MKERDHLRRPTEALGKKARFIRRGPLPHLSRKKKKKKRSGCAIALARARGFRTLSRHIKRRKEKKANRQTSVAKRKRGKEVPLKKPGGANFLGTLLGKRKKKKKKKRERDERIKSKAIRRVTCRLSSGPPVSGGERGRKNRTRQLGEKKQV